MRQGKAKMKKYYLLLFLLPLVALADVTLTATGSGYYRVYVDGVEVSQHTTQHKADEAAINAKTINSDSVVTYDHDLIVNVDINQSQSTTPENTNEQPQSIPAPNGLFFDDFEYIANRESETQATFQAHGWNAAKAINITGSHAGYIYTVETIPGYSGSFPGINSARVLALENRSATVGSQSDFYLEYGEVMDGRDNVPANVWFQFWIYVNHTTDQPSYIDRGFKFIYPSISGDWYPSNSEHWIIGLGSASYEPFWQELGANATDAFLRNRTYHGTARYTAASETANVDKLGQTDLTERIRANRWQLVKIHIDTSNERGNRYESWIKPLNGNWVKVVEWIDGVTPDFEWIIPPERVGGHGVFRMPTTVNPNHDWWIYIDDFAMTDSEADLIVY